MQLDIGHRIKELRTEKKLTQEDLAVLLGISRQTLSKWENGRGYPDIGSTVLLTEIFEIHLNDLLKGSSVEEAQLVKKLKFKKIIEQRNVLLFSLIFLLLSFGIFYIQSVKKNSLSPNDLSNVIKYLDDGEYLYKMKLRKSKENGYDSYDIFEINSNNKDSFSPVEGIDHP